MTTTLLTCAYKIRAVGAVPLATLQAAFSAVPVDLSIPNMCGLLYDSDTTAAAGQVVTRTIVFRAVPSGAATATASLFPGLPSGSPVKALALGSGGHDYAAPPLVTLTSGGSGDILDARVVAGMGVDRGIVIAGGSGYTAPTIVFSGGSLALGGKQATGTVTVAGGVVTGVTITDPGGPYNIPPSATILDVSGSGAIISPSLLVTGLTLASPGRGYTVAPTVNFNPFFASAICPDTNPTTQIAHLKNFMTGIFQAALRMPVIQVDPVIT